MEKLKGLRIFQESEDISDKIWLSVSSWDNFSRDTLGRQLARSMDSVGANIAEGYGRHGYQEHLQYLYIARGSLYETFAWLEKAGRRKLNFDRSVITKLENLLPQLNAYISYVKSKKSRN